MSGAGWTCPSCKMVRTSPFCPGCGEDAPHPRDLTLHGFLDQVAASLSNVDTKLLRSFRCLVTRPGALTLAYLEGQRKPYVLPFPLFLLANLVFFATESFTSAHIFSTPLAVHLTDQFWSPVAQSLVAQHLREAGTTLDLYAPLFNQAVLLNAKSLIILMALAFVPLLPVLFYRAHRPFVGHVVFALHLYSFLLLTFCVALIVGEIDVWRGGLGLVAQGIDHTLSVVLLLVCGVYLYIAAGRVYGAHGISGALKAGVMAVAVACILLGYRFVLLPITLWGN